MFALITLAAAQSCAASVKDAYFTTKDSTKIHYLDSGQDTAAPALVLIPGWRLPPSIWEAQIQHFSKSQRVIAVDSRSQGDSTKTTEGNTAEVRAADLQELITALGLQQVVLVGWSQGVQDVAAYVNQFDEEKLAGLVLVDTPAAAGPAEVDLRPQFVKQELGMIATFTAHPREYSEGMATAIFKKSHDATFIGRLVANMMKTPTNTAAAMLVTDMFAVDRRPVLRKISKPTLIVVAADGPLFEAEKEMSTQIANSKFVSMQGVGHALFVDDPVKFNGLLEQFLQMIGTIKTTANEGAAWGKPEHREEAQTKNKVNGVNDFDFFVGNWRVHHRRLKERLAHNDDWEEFEGSAAMQKILGGLGNMDDDVIELPGGSYCAATFRTYDPAKGLWSIWWIDGRNPGHLDPPLVGRFEDEIGTFYADDTFKGKPIRIRYLWMKRYGTPHWEQAFSGDGGKTWETNWTMDFTKAP
jgi:microsomal epoxide hydrolase